MFSFTPLVVYVATRTESKRYHFCLDFLALARHWHGLLWSKNERKMNVKGVETKLWSQGATDGRDPISSCMGLPCPDYCGMNLLA